MTTTKSKLYLLLVNLLGFVALVVCKLHLALVLVCLVCGNLVIWLLFWLYKKYRKTQDRKKLELALLDEVLVLSSQPRNNDLKQQLQKLSVSNHKIVSKEFKMALTKIEEGHSVKDVFSMVSKKYNSEMLDQFLDLLINSITTGTVSATDYRSFASNFLKTKQLMDERNSSLLLQKYTIIFAGGVIVPGILGIVISLVKKLTGTIDLTLLSSAQLVSNTRLFGVCYYCSIIYIVEYVIISSIYLSMLESNLKKTIVYSVFLGPVAILLFFVGTVLV